MQAILYVGHGSRNKQGEQEVIQFFENVKKHFCNIQIQETCFIELSEPSILGGIGNCVKKGATKIAVVPLLLLEANHAKYDIPIAVEAAKKVYPELIFTYGRPLGVNLEMIAILKANLESHGLRMDEEQSAATVLLIGRGSSDYKATEELHQASRLLLKAMPFINIEVCFLAAAKPNLIEGLQRVLSLPNKNVYVLPYLMFTGVLMETIKRKITETDQKNKKLQICSYLNFDDKLINVFVQRVNEALYLKKEKTKEFIK